jgi:hypothetical protein
MLKAYLTDTVTLKQYKGKDQWGEHSASTDLSIRAFVDQVQRVVTNQAGLLVTSSGKVLIEPRTIIFTGFSTRAANTISYQDILTINGVDYPILKIATMRDFRVRHLEVYIA